MRHGVAHRKLGRTSAHRLAMLRNLATALLEKERIRTTLMKAKELRPYTEKLITIAKREENKLHARRLVLRKVRDPRVVSKLFDTLGARFSGRAGGYTRILRLGPRRGDGAEMAIVELLGSEFDPGKGKEDKAALKAKGKAADKADKADATPDAPKKKSARGKKAAAEAAE
jgi:large subunit ribosomal protein L17